MCFCGVSGDCIEVHDGSFTVLHQRTLKCTVGICAVVCYCVQVTG